MNKDTQREGQEVDGERKHIERRKEILRFFSGIKNYLLTFPQQKNLRHSHNKVVPYA